MGAPAKAKPVRLIDLLYCMNEEDYIVVTINHGRNSISNSAKVIESTMKDYLTSEIKGLKVNSGTIQVFL
jgi:hypothetical protein